MKDQLLLLPDVQGSAADAQNSKDAGRGRSSSVGLRFPLAFRGFTAFASHNQLLLTMRPSESFSNYHQFSSLISALKTCKRLVSQKRDCKIFETQTTPSSSICLMIQLITTVRASLCGHFIRYTYSLTQVGCCSGSNVLATTRNITNTFECNSSTFCSCTGYGPVLFQQQCSFPSVALCSPAGHALTAPAPNVAV